MIEKATEKDTEKLFELLINSIKEHQKYDYEFYKLDDNLMEQLKEQILIQINDLNQHIFVKKINNMIIGFIRVLKRDSYLEIGDIYVEKEYRKQQFGTELFNYALKKLKNKEMKFVKLKVQKENNAAIQFYSNLGFNKSTIEMKLDL